MLFVGCSSAPTHPTLARSEKISLYLQMIEDSLLARDPASALTTIENAEKEFPDSPELQHAKAIAHVQREDMPAAIEASRRAVALKPSGSDVNNTLGKLLLDTGRPEEAQAYLLRAANDPKNRDAYKPLTSLGILYYRKGDLAKSQGFLSRAIQSGKDASCIAHYYRGHISVQKNDLKTAIQDYEKASRKGCAAFTDAHFALGFTYEKAHNFDAARRKYVEIEKQFPESRFATQARSRLQGLPLR